MRRLIPELEVYLVDILPRSSCIRCARCCMGKLIPIYSFDIKRLRAYVKESFYQKTTSLEKLITAARFKMRMKDNKCFFLEGKLCRYYELRPNSCRRHPFLVTEKRRLVSSTCPGVDWSSSQNEEKYKVLSKEISKSLDSFFDRIYVRK